MFIYNFRRPSRLRLNRRSSIFVVGITLLCSCGSRRLVPKLDDASTNLIVRAVSSHDTRLLESELIEAGFAPKDRDRSLEQSQFLSDALYLLASAGLACNEKMAAFLMQRFDTRLKSFGQWQPTPWRSIRSRMGTDQAIVFCYDIFLGSLKAAKQKEVVDFAEGVHEHLKVFLTAALRGDFSAADIKRVRKYSEAQIIFNGKLAALCEKSSEAKACDVQANFHKLGTQLETLIAKTKARLSAPIPPVVALTLGELQRLQKELSGQGKVAPEKPSENLPSE
jgi:hypothetical protein